MARGSMAVAVLAVAALGMPRFGMFLALGLGGLAAVVGLSAYRRRDDEPHPRLIGAAAVAVGLIAVLLGGAKVVMSWYAADAITEAARPPQPQRPAQPPR